MKAAMMLALLASFLAGRALATKCPGSPWPGLHAWAEIAANSPASCDIVKAEMIARVKGQFEEWHDPHNNGTYSILHEEPNELQLQRKTGKPLMGQYFIDKLIFTFTDSADGCQFEGCSESQSVSYKDFSTNYCDLRMLYCGSNDGCRPVSKDGDLKVTESSVSTSAGAGKDPTACFPAAESVIV